MLLVTVLLLASAAARAQDRRPAALHQRAWAPAGSSPIIVPLDMAVRASLTRHRIEVTDAAGVRECEGVSLAALLRASGAMPEAALQSGDLDRYVRIDNRDGLRVVLSLGELDLTLGGRAVYLVDRCDEAPLDADDGPLRLLVPADTRPTRGLSRVERILVVAAP